MYLSCCTDAMVTTSRVVRYMAMQIRTWEKWTSTFSRSRYHGAHPQWSRTPWNEDTSINWTLLHAAVPNTLFVYNYKPSGHLTNKDNFFCPKGVLIREVPLLSDYSIHLLCVIYTTEIVTTNTKWTFLSVPRVINSGEVPLYVGDSKGHHIFTYHLPTLCHYRRMCVVGVV